MNRAPGTLSLTVTGSAISLPADPARRFSEVLRQGPGPRG